MTVAEVRAWLGLTAQDLGDAGRDVYFGYGLVDAFAAAVPPAAPVLVAIEVTPAEPTIAPAGTQQFTATGIYDDQPPQALTACGVCICGPYLSPASPLPSVL